LLLLPLLPLLYQTMAEDNYDGPYMTYYFDKVRLQCGACLAGSYSYSGRTRLLADMPTFRISSPCYFLN
jgi:hypothetical protein